MKRKRRFLCGLLAVLLALNMFLPAVNVQADEQGEQKEQIVKVVTDDDNKLPVASPSTPTEPKDKDEEEPKLASPSTPLQPLLRMGMFAARAVKIFGDADKALFGQFVLSVTQHKGDKDTPIADGDPIDFNKPISVNLSFDVPLLFDRLQAAPDGSTEDDIDPDTYIIKGDTAVFTLGKGFNIETTGPFMLPWGNNKLGELTLSKNAAGEVIATVVFNGDDVVFTNGFDAGASFTANLKYDNSEHDGEEHNNIEVILLENKYLVNVPATSISYDKSKKGELDEANKRIKWTVEVEAYKALPSGTKKDTGLDGYTFSDDLSGIGPYMATPDPMEVNDNPVTPDWNATSKILSYTFPPNSSGKQTIEFYTQIEDIHYYSTSSKHFSNTAWVRKSEEEVEIQTTQDVVYNPPTWITKNGVESNAVTGDYNPTDRTITWSININTNGTKLPNAKIIDALTGTGVSLKEARLMQWNDITSKYDIPVAGGTWNSTHTGNEYLLGEITGKYCLIIVANIPNDAGGSTGATTNYSNQATLIWDGYSGSGSGLSSGNATVTVGYNAISKTGVVKSKENQLITWEINVNTRNQTFTNLKVYDLLVYGKDDGSFKLADFSAQLTAAGVNKDHLTPQYNQKFIPDSVTHNADSSFTLTKVTLTKGTESVADLLIFTGLNNPGSTNGQTQIKFDAKVTNPDFFAANKSKDLYNTASLISDISGDYKVINTDTGTVPYSSQLLDKEMLTRGADAKSSTDVNTKKTSALNAGFDYVDKSVIYRLSVNANGLDWTSLKNEKDELLGAVTIIDSLPPGWEFVPFDGNNQYYIFEGTKGSITSVSATGSYLNPPPEGMTSNISGGTAIFTFTSLKKPYVILVKARPDATTLKEYFSPSSSTQTQNPENKLSLKTDKWTTGISDTQKVEVKSTILDKTYAWQENARVEWKVIYNPYKLDIALDGVTDMRIEDQMPEGMELKEDSVKVHEMTLNADGTLTEGSDITSTAHIEYKNANRLLTFYLPDKTKAYKLTYNTIIVSETNNEKLSNTVKLFGSKTNGVTTGADYYVKGAEASARFKFGGAIKIHKKGNGTDLNGVTFELRKKGEDTPFRTGTSKNGGKISLAVLPMGEYTLIETYAPDPYKVSKTTYNVEIKQNPDSSKPPITLVDGVEIADELVITNMETNALGDLIIWKTVEGNSDKTKDSFNFTVTLSAPDRYPYEKKDSTGVIETGFIKNGDTVSLKHNQTMTVYDLPTASTYTIEEEDLSAKGYVTPDRSFTGNISSIAPAEAHFTNYQPGSLTIKKQVTLGDSKKPFDFTVIFTKNGIEDTTTYTYTGNNGAPNGTIKSKDTISLSDGQSITISNIPKDTEYKVTETSYASEGYEEPTISGKASDKILAGEDSTVVFKNSQSLLGGLIISKTVIGNRGSKTKKFTFTVTFDNNGTYDYVGKGVPNGKITSGNKIELADGQSISISGLLHGMKYTVIEDDYSSEGYKTESSGHEGTISKDITAKAEFTNSNYYHGGGGGNGGGNPKTPTNPTPTTPTPAPTPEPVNPGPVPQGYLEGPDGSYYTPQQLYDVFGQVPLGFMVGPNGMLVPLGGLPKTSDGGFHNAAVFGLVSISALLGMAISVNSLRKKRS
ncbi:MAG: DUF5979 domain-containing protein [Lacrimispora sp.]|uniref:DUF7601 domain-containing protein n=1 Tax=Lacrimispora sp. TaxID=2719234 RepID=UPI0039E3B64E